MMPSRFLCGSSLRKPRAAFARVLSDSVARSPWWCRPRGREEVCDIPTPATSKRSMRADPTIDPNAELRTFEPLRVLLALGSLLLALLISLQ